MKMDPPGKYSAAEEIANWITHGLGALLAGSVLHYFAVLIYVIPGG